MRYVMQMQVSTFETDLKMCAYVAQHQREGAIISNNNKRMGSLSRMRECDAPASSVSKRRRFRSHDGVLKSQNNKGSGLRSQLQENNVDT